MLIKKKNLPLSPAMQKDKDNPSFAAKAWGNGFTRPASCSPAARALLGVSKKPRGRLALTTRTNRKLPPGLQEHTLYLKEQIIASEINIVVRLRAGGSVFRADCYVPRYSSAYRVGSTLRGLPLL